VLRLCVFASLLVAVGLSANAQITVRVWDNGSAKDDRAKVYVDGVQLAGATEIAGDGSGYTRASAEGTTWDLGSLSSGTHTLTVEHAMDIDAPSSGVCAEVVGTYGIEFGGGGLTAMPDFDQVGRGSTGTIDVLANDVLIEAGDTATDTIPCPSELPAPETDCGCSTRHTFETTFDVSDGSGTLEVEAIVTPPIWGTAEISLDRSAILYTPGPDACGSDAFEYSVSAPGLGSASAVVTLAILNATPSASDDAYETLEDQALSVSASGVLDNDFDADGDALTAHLIQDVAHGTLSLSEDGSLTYEPFPDYEGMDVFSYRAEDGCSASTTATVTLAVAAVNDAPEGMEDNYALDGFGSLEVSAPGVLANDRDVENDQLRAVLERGASHGSVELRADGSFTYRPEAGFSGVDAFFYRASDGMDSSDAVRVEIDVLYANTPPVADAGSFYEGVVGESISLDASLSFDRDPLDRLQFRWDFDDDWFYDTDWLESPFVDHVWDLPYEGLIAVQVRDVYGGQPTGDTAEATAYVSIHSVQSIRVVVFDDVDGDGQASSSEPGLSGLAVVVGEETLTTGPDGGVAIQLSPGSWPVALGSSAIETLKSLGYAVPVTERTVALASGEHRVVALAAQRTTTKLQGIVFVDANGDGSYGDGDVPAAGLRVTLDGDSAMRTTTDARGRFFFLRVAFGDHRVSVTQVPVQGESTANATRVDVAVLVSRGATNEVLVPWPVASGPKKGFLDVKVKVGGGG